MLWLYQPILPLCWKIFQKSTSFERFWKNKNLKKSHQRDHNSLRLGGGVHQGEDSLGAHSAAEDAVKGRGGSSALHVAQNGDPRVQESML